MILVWLASLYKDMGWTSTAKLELCSLSAPTKGTTPQRI
jgi:hypothetical protein